MSERHFRRLRDRFEAEGAQGPCSGSNPYAGRQRVALLYLRYFNRLASSTGGFPHVTWPGHHVAIIGSLFNCRHGRDPIAFRRWTRISAMSSSRPWKTPGPPAETTSPPPMRRKVVPVLPAGN